MKYSDLFQKRTVLQNIPLMFEGRELSADMQARVMLMRVAYDKQANEFETDMQEVVKGLKKEGFDERSQHIQKMRDIDARRKAAKEWKEGDKDAEGKPVEKPAMPTKEELKEADEIRKTEEAYNKELQELEEKYRKSREKKMEEDCGMEERKFTEKEYVSVIELITFKGNISMTYFNGAQIELSREEFLAMVAVWLVA